MGVTIMSDKPAIAFKHGTYVIDKNGPGDAVIVKEVAIYPDGRRVPGMRIIKDFKRDFYITREGARTNKDKLEWIEKSKCQKFSTTERDMNKRIRQALGIQPGMYMSRKMLMRSPYVFGCDIDITSLVGNMYKTRYPDVQYERSTVAVIDIETNVHSKEKEIIMCSITFKKNVYLAVTADWCKEHSDPVAYFTKHVNEQIGDLLKKREVNLVIEVKPTPGAVAKACIDKAHEWMPDFLTLWNLDYDMPRIFAAIQEDGHDLEDVFSHPTVPKNLRYFYYAKGQTRKQKANGDYMTIAPAEQWHTVHCPASFYIIDAMPVYRILRRVKGMLPSYALDYVTTHELGEGKLKFHDASEPYVKEGSLDWHRLMQRKHKGVYAAYNIVDCIRIEELDEKTTDLSKKVGILKGPSHYKDFNSNPRRIVDKLHFYLEDLGYSIGTTSDQMKDDLDSMVVDMRDWIVTLSSVLVEEFGVKVIKDLNRDSTFYIHNADLDIVSTYPTVGVVLNISKETCMFELSRIAGINGKERRSIGINLTGGPTNASIICEKVFKLKVHKDLLAEFDADMEVKEGATTETFNAMDLLSA